MIEWKRDGVIEQNVIISDKSTQLFTSVSHLARL
jgi:hypothetical protein